MVKGTSVLGGVGATERFGVEAEAGTLLGADERDLPGLKDLGEGVMGDGFLELEKGVGGRAMAGIT